MPGLAKAFLSATTPEFNTSGIVPTDVFAPVTYSGSGSNLTVTNNLNMANALANHYEFYGNLIGSSNIVAGIEVCPSINNVVYTVTGGTPTEVGGVFSDEVTCCITAFSNISSEAISVLWARKIVVSIPSGSSGGISAFAACADDLGNLYVSFTSNFATSGHDNTYIFKYSASGLLQWQQEISNQGTAVTSMVTDTSGNLYVVIPQPNTSGINGISIIKINSSGSILNQFNYGFTYTLGNSTVVVNTSPGGTETIAPAIACDIDCDSSGNLYLAFYTGNFSSNIPLSTYSFGLTYGVAKIANTGAVVFSNLLPAPVTGSQSGGSFGGMQLSLAVDNVGNIYTYAFSPLDMSHAYLIKMNSSGTILWTNRTTGSVDSAGLGLAIDSSNNVYIAGFTNSLNGPICKLNPAGTAIWQAQISGMSVANLALDSSGNIYPSGQWVGSVTTDGGVDSTTTQTCGYMFFTPTGAFSGSPATIDTMTMDITISDFDGTPGTATLSTVTPVTFTSETFVATSGGIVAAGSTLNTELTLTFIGGSLTDSSNSLTNFFSSGNAINDTGFLVWIMNRTTGSSALFDSIRGLVNSSNESRYLQTTNNHGEIFNSNLGVTNPTGTGFTVGPLPQINTNGNNYISWSFLAAQKFFDIVTYNGNAAGQNIPHNLGVAPALIIIATMSGAFGSGSGSYTGPLEWIVWLNSSLGYLFLNEPNSSPNPNQAEYLGNNTITVLPTSTHFTIGGAQDIDGLSVVSGVQEAPFTYIAYLFANTPGVTSVGTYTGNGTTRSINCEFNSGARFVLIGSQTGWYVFDTARGIVGPAGGLHTPYLTPSAVTAEVTNDDSVFPSANGFSVQAGSAALNTNGVVYAYFAIA